MAAVFAERWRRPPRTSGGVQCDWVAAVCENRWPLCDAKRCPLWVRMPGRFATRISGRFDENTHQYLDHQHRRIWRTAAFGARRPWSGAVDAGGQRLEVHVFGQADQRVANLGTPIFAFMFGKQADPGLHHCGTRWWRADPRILLNLRTAG